MVRWVCNSRDSVPGYSYFRMCLVKSERNCLTSYLQQSSRVLFLFACLKACFRLSLSTRNKKKRTVTSKKHAYRPETSYCVYYSLKLYCYMKCVNRLDPNHFYPLLCCINKSNQPCLTVLQPTGSASLLIVRPPLLTSPSKSKQG